ARRHAGALGHVRELGTRAVLRGTARREQLRAADALHGRRRVRRTADRGPAGPPGAAERVRPRDGVGMTAWVAAGEARTTAAISVRLERLRAGLAGETLFVVPGMAGDPNELTTLAAAFTGPQEVYAVAPALAGPRHRTAATMEAIAAHMVTAIRQVQPAGPYRLGGYSFGGVLALEMAEQLHAAGEVVQPV